MNAPADTGRCTAAADNGRVLIAPSVLSADFTRLAEAVAVAEAGGADYIHVDVMDGHFVPNLTIGPPVIKALKRVATVPLDVHIMIDNPDSTIDWYLDAGADSVSVHIEASPQIGRTLRRIRERGASPAVTLNPGTPVSAVRTMLAEVDMVLVMSVNPGFGGQSFIEDSVGRIAELAALCATEGASPLIQVDGGINSETAAKVTAVGARCLVAGNAVFGQPDIAKAIADIRSAAEAALG
ncbi:MAG: ribulose-phosphate 3-epimerase [Coriobacteriia bacterium]|nr:ribulose-phosphate 3-epimerase [Coriobacteriia bacterium]